MTIRLPDLHIVPRRRRAACASGSPGQWASTWRCPRCGTERHFAGPVPAAAAEPCPACGGSTLLAVE